MYLHGTRGAELLTAEATDAPVAVNDGLAVDHLDGLGGADLGALAATHALALGELGAGGQKLAQHPAHQLALGGEKMAVAYGHVLKIPHGKVCGTPLRFVRSYDQKRDLGGQQSPLTGGGQGGDGVLGEPDELTAHLVHRVGGRGGQEQADVAGRALGGAV